MSLALWFFAVRPTLLLKSLLILLCLLITFTAAQHEENLLIERIEDIRHHIRIESAVQEGSQNMLKHLKVLKTVDKKALQEVVHTPPASCIHVYRIVSMLVHNWFKVSTIALTISISPLFMKSSLTWSRFKTCPVNQKLTVVVVIVVVVILVVLVVFVVIV